MRILKYSRNSIFISAHPLRHLHFRSFRIHEIFFSFHIHLFLSGLYTSAVLPEDPLPTECLFYDFSALGKKRNGEKRTEIGIVDREEGVRESDRREEEREGEFARWHGKCIARDGMEVGSRFPAEFFKLERSFSVRDWLTTSGG